MYPTEEKKEALMSTELTITSSTSGKVDNNFRVSTEESCLPEISTDTPMAQRYKLLALGQVGPITGSEVTQRDTAADVNLLSVDAARLTQTRCGRTMKNMLEESGPTQAS